MRDVDIFQEIIFERRVHSFCAPPFAVYCQICSVRPVRHSDRYQIDSERKVRSFFALNRRSTEPFRGSNLFHLSFAIRFQLCRIKCPGTVRFISLQLHFFWRRSERGALFRRTRLGRVATHFIMIHDLWESKRFMTFKRFRLIQSERPHRLIVLRSTSSRPRPVRPFRADRVSRA